MNAHFLVALISEVEHPCDVEAHLRQVLEAEEHQAHTTQTEGGERGGGEGEGHGYACVMKSLCKYTFGVNMNMATQVLLIKYRCLYMLM
jgi:hypothetical protein